MPAVYERLTECRIQIAMHPAVLLLLLAGAYASAQACRRPPCAATQGVASYLDNMGCCAGCRPGFACNGTHAVPCAPPAQFQAYSFQTTCSTVRACASDLEYEWRAPTATSDRGCKLHSVCDTAIEYERIGATTTTDRVCNKVKECIFPSEYEQRAPTANTDRVCAPVRVCDPTREIMIRARTNTSDAVCACSSGHLYTEAGCTPCFLFVDGCETCSRRNGTVVCDRCGASLQPVRGADNETARCTFCETSNCAECKQDEVCSSCRPGFTLQIDAVTTAASCICSAAFCKSCHRNGTCASCLAGFEMRDGQCECLQPGCRTCDGAGRCTECEPNFALSAAGSCYCVIEHCEECDASGTACLVCRYPFVSRAANGSRCECALEGCVACNTTGCQECADGVQLLADQTCGLAAQGSTTSAAATTSYVVIAAMVSTGLLLLVGLAVFTLRRRKTKPQDDLPPLPPPRYREPVRNATYDTSSRLYEELCFNSVTMLPKEPEYTLATDSQHLYETAVQGDITYNPGPLYDTRTVGNNDGYFDVAPTV